MLTIVRSCVPSVLSEPTSLPADVANGLQSFWECPQRCQWIVPTGRRRRALLSQWLHKSQRPANLFPAVHTFESFVLGALAYSIRQQPRVSNPERLLRVARAWYEVTARPAGPSLVRQLDRFARDWQACGLDTPTTPADDFERLVERYTEDLRADGRLDRMSSVRVLTEDVRAPESWLNRLYLTRIRGLCFDGFHRLEKAELGLIAQLSHRCEVLVWLVGAPGQPSWPTLEWSARLLQDVGAKSALIDHQPEPLHPLSEIGRQLFLPEPILSAPADSVPGLFKLEAVTVVAEVETVAKRIKADYLASQGTGRALRLADVAVVIPGPAYDPLIREVFPRVGLEFNLAGQALRVSRSRPARVLIAALELIRGQWRHDLLRDFLSLPLVRRRLDESHRLYDLFGQRPRARRQLGHQVWLHSWDQYLRKLRERINGWQSGRLELPERTVLTRAELVERQMEVADSMQRLVQSIQAVLEPVAAIAELVEKTGSVSDLVAACIRLLHLLEIEQWLSPHLQRRDLHEKQYGVALPWVEYEKDQQAYYQLLRLLETLTGLPQNRTPMTSEGRPDALAALLLALDNQSYQIKTEDDAGVQLFELREIRGLRFRHVYVLGLVDGQIPRLPEEGVLAWRRRQHASLNEQQQQQEAEFSQLFSQLFEAARERLVLARPLTDADQNTLPSPFLASVEERVQLAVLEPARLTTSPRDAAVGLGQAVRGARAGPRPLHELWPCAKGADLEATLCDLGAWQKRSGWPHRIGIDSSALMQALFPNERSFSPSELETYAACPFRYFGARILRLEERDVEQTRLRYGLLMHRVLQAFYNKLRQTFSGQDQEPLPPVVSEHWTQFVQLFDEEWAQLDDGTLPPHLRTLFTCAEGVLQLFLEESALLEGEHGNLLNEFVLQDRQGNPLLLGTDSAERPVHLTGKIDRIDVRRADIQRAIVLDYKTGRVPVVKERLAKAVDGRMIQLPLYAAALRLIRTELHVVGGAYIHLHERETDARKAIASAGEITLSGSRTAFMPFDMGAARDKALELAGRIRAGDFSLTEHSVDTPHPECSSFCTMRHACRHPDGYKVINGS